MESTHISPSPTRLPDAPTTENVLTSNEFEIAEPEDVNADSNISPSPNSHEESSSAVDEPPESTNNIAQQIQNENRNAPSQTSASDSHRNTEIADPTSTSIADDRNSNPTFRNIENADPTSTSIADDRSSNPIFSQPQSESSSFLVYGSSSSSESAQTTSPHLATPVREHRRRTTLGYNNIPGDLPSPIERAEPEPYLIGDTETPTSAAQDIHNASDDAWTEARRGPGTSQYIFQAVTSPFRAFASMFTSPIAKMPNVLPEPNISILPTIDPQIQHANDNLRRRTRDQRLQPPDNSRRNIQPSAGPFSDIANATDLQDALASQKREHEEHLKAMTDRYDLMFKEMNAQINRKNEVPTSNTQTHELLMNAITNQTSAMMNLAKNQNNNPRSDARSHLATVSMDAIPGPDNPRTALVDRIISLQEYRRKLIAFFDIAYPAHGSRIISQIMKKADDAYHATIRAGPQSQERITEKIASLESATAGFTDDDTSFIARIAEGLSQKILAKYPTHRRDYASKSNQIIHALYAMRIATDVKDSGEISTLQHKVTAPEINLANLNEGINKWKQLWSTLDDLGHTEGCLRRAVQHIINRIENDLHNRSHDSAEIRRAALRIELKLLDIGFEGTSTSIADTWAAYHFVTQTALQIAANLPPGKPRPERNRDKTPTANRKSECGSWLAKGECNNKKTCVHEHITERCGMDKTYPAATSWQKDHASILRTANSHTHPRKVTSPQKRNRTSPAISKHPSATNSAATSPKLPSAIGYTSHASQSNGLSTPQPIPG